MLKLPSRLFQHIFLFGSPEDAFSSQSTCKQFQKELHSDAFWKSMKKIHAPNMESPGDAETHFRALSYPRLDFCLKIKNGELVHEIKWDSAFCAYEEKIPPGPIADALWKNVMGYGQYEETFTFAARYRGQDGEKSREVKFDLETANGAEGMDYALLAELDYAYIGMKIARDESKVSIGAVWLTEPWMYLCSHLDDQDFANFVEEFFIN